MLTSAIFCALQVHAEADKAFDGLKAGEAPPRRGVDDMVYTLSVLKETLRRCANS